ncbi:MAG TPA: hypothetical protein VEX35_03695 [Allosphingosinicella sp.]|nr:hypothetical protein [Allosphingosinicella sp.]
MHWPAILTAALLAIPLSPVRAACSYGGVDNATTTMAQQFRDSRWVVRARVLAADNHWSDDGESWTRYSLAVVRAYKGAPPARLAFFTTRDSGAFYLDRGTMPDLGGEYLLFLNPIRPYRGQLPAARGAVFVNYACGQSRPWAEVPGTDERRLDLLAGRPTAGGAAGP